MDMHTNSHTPSRLPAEICTSTALGSTASFTPTIQTPNCKTMARYLFVLLAAVLLAASAEAATRQLLQADDATCAKKVQDAGGQDTIKSLLQGACQGKGDTVDALVNSDCCSTVQAIAQQAGGCECNPTVWSQVEGLAKGAGVAAITDQTLGEFLSKCTAAKGFKVKGYGC